MTKSLPWMVLSALLSLPVLAIDINEQLPNVRLLALYPNNIIVLNRSITDGIRVGSHIKLLTSEGYAARGVCVKTGQLTSHWKIYRIVESELISKDLTYTIVGMDSSEAPKFAQDWNEIDHSKIVPKFDDSFLKDPEKAPSAKLSSDLPESLEGYKEERKSITQAIIEKTFDAEKLKRDFQVVKASIFASPWTTQKGGQNSIESIRYGGSIANEGTRYKMNVNFERVSLRATNSQTQDEIINESSLASARFAVKNFSDNFDLYSDITFRQQRFGRLSTPKSHYLLAPVGMTWHYKDGETFKKVSFSYAPTYEIRAHEILNSANRVEEEEVRGLRHAFRLYFEVPFSKEFTITSETLYRPRQEISTWSIDVGDSLTEQRLAAQVKLLDDFFMVYEYHWLDDAQLNRINGLSRIVQTSSLNFKLNFGL